MKKSSDSWAEYKISEIFKITRGVVIPKTELLEKKTDEYKYPVYSSQTSNNGILGYDTKFDFDGKYLTWTTELVDTIYIHEDKNVEVLFKYKNLYEDALRYLK